MAEAPGLAVGALLDGKYRIERVLGRGGMGAVYLAENVVVGRKVAVKLLHHDLLDDPQTLVRFRLEARAAAAVGHPGIVDVFDLGSADDGSEYIVMEALEGETLGARIERRGRLPAEELLPIMCSVLDALAAAHDKGIVHRDLKPENVFLVSAPVPGTRILDFGISKFRDTEELRLTSTGAAMGTPLYMSPEQARGAREVGPATDLYAIGGILYKGLTGEPPIFGSSYSEVLSKLLMDPPRPILEVLPTLDPALGAVVDRLLAKKPGDRPESAVALRATLLSLSDSAATRPELAPPPAVATLQRRRSALVALGLTAAACLTVGVLVRRTGSKVTAPAPAPATQLAPAVSPVAAPVAGTTAAPASTDVAPAPRPVGLTLRAEPAAAHWSIDGTALDGNPCTVRRPAGATAEATASAPGHQPTTISLRFDVDREVALVLPPARATRAAERRERPHPRAATPPGSGALELDRKNPFAPSAAPGR